MKTGLGGERGRFVVFCIFIACVFAMGGGSRADIASLVLLRPIAFLVAGYALLVAQPRELRPAALPLGLLACLAAIIGAQLVPLPPGLWSALPGRELYVTIARDAGLQVPWRPLSLAPSRTLNALFSLSVPLATILIVSVQVEERRKRILAVLTIACAASALMAIAQMASSGNGALYLYKVTNPGFPVGLLANRNHEAILMVILLVLIAHFYRRFRGGTQSSLLVVGAVISALVVLSLVLVAGSRAGLLLAVAALPIVVWMLTRREGPSAGSNPSIRKMGTRQFWIAGAAVLLLAGVIATFGLSRAVSLERLMAGDPLSDYRVARLPLVLDILRDQWLFGAGFGSFEGFFQRYESVDQLTPFVFNQAHNDWLQFPLEGGIPAAAVLLFALACIVRAVPAVVRAANRGRIGVRFVSLIALGLIALASTVDYPLRTPIFMVIATISFMFLTRSAAENPSQDPRPSA